MNKRKVNNLIPKAYQVLFDVGIAKADGKINRKWRSQISSFGASVMQGSLTAAVAFFSKQGSADVDRAKLMEAIACMIDYEGTLFMYVSNTDEHVAKENIVNAAVALKLAMNLYDMEDDKNRGENNA